MIVESVALLMIVNNEIKEHRIQSTMSENVSKERGLERQVKK